MSQYFFYNFRKNSIFKNFPQLSRPNVSILFDISPTPSPPVCKMLQCVPWFTVIQMFDNYMESVCCSSGKKDNVTVQPLMWTTMYMIFLTIIWINECYTIERAVLTIILPFFITKGRFVNIFKGAHCTVLYILSSIELYVCLLFVKIFVYTQSLNVRV